MREFLIYIIDERLAWCEANPEALRTQQLCFDLFLWFLVLVGLPLMLYIGSKLDSKKSKEVNADDREQ